MPPVAPAMGVSAGMAAMPGRIQQQQQHVLPQSHLGSGFSHHPMSPMVPVVSAAGVGGGYGQRSPVNSGSNSTVGGLI